jgi:transcriptional pleiotropic regulator of transition state genes
MKTVGVARKISNSGRISIPREYCNLLKIKDDATLDVYIDGDRIVLAKHESSCVFCGKEEKITQYRGRTVCTHCLEDMAGMKSTLSLINSPSLVVA